MDHTRYRGQTQKNGPLWPITTYLLSTTVEIVTIHGLTWFNLSRSSETYSTPNPPNGRYSTASPGATPAQFSGSSTSPSAQASDDSAPELLVW